MARYNTAMLSATEHAVTLSCHAETPSNAVRRIGARVRRLPDGMLSVTYVLDGNIDRLRLPPPRPPRFAEGLWRHSCCEIFIAREGLPAYHEFNLAPSGEWAAFAFERYRDGAPLADEELNPKIVLRGGPDKMELDALIRLNRLSPEHADARLTLAMSAVIEEEDGSLSYWALKHAPGKPDFHHPDAFALELA